MDNDLDKIYELLETQILQKLVKELDKLEEKFAACSGVIQTASNVIKTFDANAFTLLSNLKSHIAKFSFAYSALSKAFNGAVDYAQQGNAVKNFAMRTGLAADKFQTLANAAEHYGGTAAETSQIMANLRKNLEDLKKGGDGNGLKDTLDAFNINPAGIMSTDQALEVIAGRMETLKNDAEKFDFGRDLGLDDATIQLVSGGLANMNSELANSKQYNMFSQEDLERSEELNGTINDLSMGLQAIAANVGQLLLPVLVPLFNGIKHIVDFFASNAEMVKAMIVEVSSVIATLLLPALVGIVVPLLPMIGIVAGIVAAFVALNWVIGEFIAWIIGKDSVFTGWFGDFKTFKTGLMDGFRQIGDNIVNFCTMVGQKIHDVFFGACNFVKSAFTTLASKLKSVFSAITEFIKNLIAKALEIVPDWVIKLLSVANPAVFAVKTISKGVNILKDRRQKQDTAANGIGFVPFDGYLTELHKGESVLDKSEANIWRGLQAGKDAISATSNIPLASIPQGAVTNAYRTQNVSKTFTIGDITIQTAATDADGIANELVQSIKMAFNGLDTGVKA